MLSDRYLKPYLLHERIVVRNEVTKYFADFQSQDVDLLPLVLQACDRYGYEGSSLSLSLASKFVVTEKALLHLTERLNEQHTFENLVRLNHILEETPLPLVQQYETLLRQTKYIAEPTWHRFDQRMSLSEKMPEELFSLLQEYSKECDYEYINEVDYRYVEDVLDRLAETDYPSEEHVCSLLRSPSIEGTYLEFFLIDLSGKRRLKSAIPALIEKYKLDEDVLLDQVTKALARIRDPLPVQLVCQEYPEQDWNYKNFTSGMLGKIKCEASEFACLELLATEDNALFHTFLCMSLCELFSARGIDAVREEIHHGYDVTITDLEEQLIVVSDVTGVDFLEKGQWLNEKEKRDERRKQAMQSKFQFPSAPKLKRQPPRRSAKGKQKIGRNEPCPCGSGKKYKKCCGR